MPFTLSLVLLAGLTPTVCWDSAQRMESEGVSRESVEAYLTKCLVNVGKALECEPAKSKSTPSQELQAKIGF